MSGRDAAGVADNLVVPDCSNNAGPLGAGLEAACGLLTVEGLVGFS
ncbi:MAG TPA: hypothetical protein PK812_02600 [Beijerinckiaceae bacterium]|nr:hypothetical protein [Beijerinckiaceae bacterium]